MDLAFYNVDNGYAEAICRGLRASFLRPEKYEALKASSSLADFKTVLEETDYGSLFISENPTLPVSVIRQKLKKKLADEFTYLAGQTVQPLYRFLQLMQSRYMIDNVVNIIEGIKNKVDIDILIANTDPLGYFPEIKSLRLLEADDYSSLYSSVLIDTPVGPYFMKFLEDVLEALNENITIHDIQSLFKDIKPEFIRTSLKKMWLEDFYTFCENELDDNSKQVMLDLLKFEADCKTIQVIYNSIGNKELSSAASRSSTRKHLCPSLGHLYPDCERELTNVTSLEGLREAVKYFSQYRDMLRDVPDPQRRDEFNVDAKSLDDIMYEEESKMYSLAFDLQNQSGIFYAYLKLKEQEIRNIVWLAEMVSRKLPKTSKAWSKIIIPFARY
eukprot:TRINITY_DN2456_c0_g1_i2.p1 TRINITY_DN2456_c0_g1~~TRINITY_DN2456_c0_g1_i2.p1  ORF type:complete len:386 (-),score=119.40 TRINITY_DN2456_c0_g1_i2:120-1277(-)